MGKKLIIKGADFSENGFFYNVTVIENTDLYDGDGNKLTTQTEWTNLSSNGTGAYYTFATNGNVLKTGTITTSTARAACISGKITLPANANSVEVSTGVNLGYSSANAAGLIYLAFLDAEDHIIAGYASSDTQEQVGTTPLTPVGVGEGSGASKGYKTLSMNVPEGAVSVVSCYKNPAGRPFTPDGGTPYSLKITCVDVE